MCVHTLTQQQRLGGARSRQQALWDNLSEPMRFRSQAEEMLRLRAQVVGLPIGSQAEIREAASFSGQSINRALPV